MDNKDIGKELGIRPLPKKLSYLTEEEAKMPLRMALLQLTLGLQTCKTKQDAIELLNDAVILGRRSIRKKR